MNRCKPGDLAVIIGTANEVNLGRIVRVIEHHHGRDPMAMVHDYPVRNTLFSISHRLGA